MFLRIFTTEYTQYSGPDCESIFCHRDITTEITSEEFLINAIPDLPEVPQPEDPDPIVDLNEPLPEPSATVNTTNIDFTNELITTIPLFSDIDFSDQGKNTFAFLITSGIIFLFYGCLLYTSPSPRDQRGSRMPSSA